MKKEGSIIDVPEIRTCTPGTRCLIAKESGKAKKDAGRGKNKATFIGSGKGKNKVTVVASGSGKGKTKATVVARSSGKGKATVVAGGSGKGKGKATAGGSATRKRKVVDADRKATGNQNVAGSGARKGKENARMRVFDPAVIIPLSMRPKSATFKKHMISEVEDHWCKGGAVNCTCWAVWIKYEAQQNAGQSSTPTPIAPIVHEHNANGSSSTDEDDSDSDDDLQSGDEEKPIDLDDKYSSDFEDYNSFSDDDSSGSSDDGSDKIQKLLMVFWETLLMLLETSGYTF